MEVLNIHQHIAVVLGIKEKQPKWTQIHVPVLNSGDWMSAVGHIFEVLLKHYCSIQGLIWSDHITGRAKTVLPHHKKKKTGVQNFPARSSSHWHCAKNLTTPQETKMITQGWVREGKGYRKTNPIGPMYERTRQLMWLGGGMDSYQTNYQNT